MSSHPATDDLALSPIASALADIWADILVAELTKNEEPALLVTAAGPGVHEGDREHADGSTPESDRSTFVDRVARLFQSRPNQWVSSFDLERAGGRQAWRTRVSDARRRFGLNIVNRTRRVVRTDGTSYVVSEYCYLPAASAGAAA